MTISRNKRVYECIKATGPTDAHKVGEVLGIDPHLVAMSIRRLVHCGAVRRVVRHNKTWTVESTGRTDLVFKQPTQSIRKRAGPGTATKRLQFERPLLAELWR